MAPKSTIGVVGKKLSTSSTKAKATSSTKTGASKSKSTGGTKSAKSPSAAKKGPADAKPEEKAVPQGAKDVTEAGSSGTDAAELQQEPAPQPAGPVEGSAHVRYNHYNQPFSILDGTIAWETIDDEYAISFVFEGNFGKILKDENGTELPIRTDGTAGWKGLEDGKSYVLEISEDPEFAEEDEAGIQWGGVGGAAQGMGRMTLGADGEDSASCSCLEGNPCVSKYNCLDWNNREAVAAAARRRKGMAD